MSNRNKKITELEEVLEILDNALVPIVQGSPVPENFVVSPNTLANKIEEIIDVPRKLGDLDDVKANNLELVPISKNSADEYEANPNIAVDTIVGNDSDVVTVNVATLQVNGGANVEQAFFADNISTNSLYVDGEIQTAGYGIKVLHLDNFDEVLTSDGQTRNINTIQQLKKNNMYGGKSYQPIDLDVIDQDGEPYLKIWFNPDGAIYTYPFYGGEAVTIYTNYNESYDGEVGDADEYEYITVPLYMFPETPSLNVYTRVVSRDNPPIYDIFDNGKILKDTVYGLNDELITINSNVAGKEAKPVVTTTITKNNFVWYKDWLKITTSEIITGVDIKVHYLKARTERGWEFLDAIVSYPSAETKTSSSAYSYFYLKDKDGLISKASYIDIIEVGYTLLGTINSNYDFQSEIETGINIIIDENANSQYHSDSGLKTIQSVYPYFPGQVIQTVLDLGDELSAKYTPTYCVEKDADVIIRPYTGGAVSENWFANPNIITVASHNGNTFTRVDITNSPTKFLDNAIAIGSCPSSPPVPTIGTSYGNGMEFWEPGNNDNLDNMYTEAVNDFALTSNVLLDVTRVIVDVNNTGIPLGNIRGFQVGSEVELGTLNGTRQVRVVQNIINDQTFEVAGAFDPIQPNSYLWFKVPIGTYWQWRKWLDYPTNTVNSNTQYAQSSVCSIVASKLKEIKLSTGVSWNIIREAARYTAIKPNKVNPLDWDMYRGFGMIDISSAITYIQENYLNSTTYQKELSDNLQRTSGISNELDYTYIKDNSPIRKKDLESKISSEEIFISSPNGTKFKITVSNAGVLAVTPI